MSDHELDQRISVALRDRAETVASHDLVPGMRARAARHQRRRVIAGGATAIIVAAGLTGLVTVINHAQPGDQPLATPGASKSPENLPAVDNESLLKQLAADPGVRQELTGRKNPEDAVLCGINIVGHNAANTRLFVWLSCGRFTAGPDATLLSASAESAVVTVGGGMVTGVEFPRQAHLDEDIDRLFPTEIADRIRVGDLPTTPNDSQLLAEARALR